MTEYVLTRPQQTYNDIVFEPFEPLILRQEKEEYGKKGSLSFLAAHQMIKQLLTDEHIETKEVVSFRNANYPHILLEASGNVTLDTIQAIATTGVDAISSGSVIHQANWIDLSMKVGKQ